MDNIVNNYMKVNKVFVDKVKVVTVIKTIHKQVLNIILDNKDDYLKVGTIVVKVTNI